MYFGTLPGFGCLGELPATAATPPFRFHCTPGCHPHTADKCRALLDTAIRDAVALGDTAARRLWTRDSTVLEPFRRFFGDPELKIPWANNIRTADLVGVRFKAAANGFRTRVPHFHCYDPAEGACTVGIKAFITVGARPTREVPYPRNTIFLCPEFFAQPPHLRAGTVLHEMIHLLYWEFLRHDFRYANAFCYEAFALEISGHGADPGDILCCSEPTRCDRTAKTARATRT